MKGKSNRIMEFFITFHAFKWLIASVYSYVNFYIFDSLFTFEGICAEEASGNFLLFIVFKHYDLSRNQIRYS